MRTMLRRRRRTPGFLAALGLLAMCGMAACGSTVPTGAHSLTGAAGGLGLQQPATAPSAAAGAAEGPGQAIEPVTTGAAATNSSTGVSVTGPVVTSESAGRPPGALAPGITATTIKIGVYTVQAFSNVMASAGVNVQTGDQGQIARAVIKYLNAHGGMAGRRIIPVFHDFDLAKASADVNTEYQEACASWTQDNRVFAVTSPVGTLTDNLYACLAKAGVIMSATGDTRDAEFFRQYANYFYMPIEINMTRMLRNEAFALADEHFFGKSPKIGVVRIDIPAEQRAVANGLRPALAQLGLKVAAEFAAPDDSSASSAYSSAVLRFKTLGITHVIFSELGSPIEFMTDAQSQGYHPRYGLNSRSGPASVLQGNVPQQQLSGSMGIGWQPMNDVDGSHDPGPSSARTKLCLKLVQDAGQNTGVRSVAAVGLWLCDGLFFLRDALARTTSLTPAGFRAGAESLRTYEAASTFRAGFSPGQLHDGATAYRVFSYNDSCPCFTYVTPQRATQ